MRRRRFALAAGSVAFGLTVGTIGLVLRSPADDVDDDDGGDGQETSVDSTATVARRDLEERARLAGTLGYGDRQQVPLASEGTVTAVAPPGTVVDRGGVLLEVDGAPVPLLFGARPLWRELGPGIADGSDVEQVEANLVALGFASPSALTVDRHWTEITTSAVREWQRSLGREPTGVVAPGDAIVLPGSARISGHPTLVGRPVGEAAVEVTGTTRLVTVDLEASRQGLVAVDQEVQVELPDGTTIEGRVADVGRVARREDGASDELGTSAAPPTIDVTIVLEDADAGGSLDEAPVSVLVVTSAAEAVLAVPVDALLALAEGGFAVERVESAERTQLVVVETGAFSDGWVEVVAEDLAEGDQVVVPDDHA